MSERDKSTGQFVKSSYVRDDVPRTRAERRAFLVDETMATDGGYIPSVVIEGEPYTYPMLGNGSHSRPWVWGPTLAEAKEQAREINEKLGLDRSDVTEICASAMSVRDRYSGEVHFTPGLGFTTPCGTEAHGTETTRAESGVTCQGCREALALGFTPTLNPRSGACPDGDFL